MIASPAPATYAAGEPAPLVRCALGAAGLGATLERVGDPWVAGARPRRAGLAPVRCPAASFVSLVAASPAYATVVAPLVLGVLVGGGVDGRPFALGTVVVLGRVLASDLAYGYMGRRGRGVASEVPS